MVDKCRDCNLIVNMYSIIIVEATSYMIRLVRGVNRKYSVVLRIRHPIISRNRRSLIRKRRRS